MSDGPSPEERRQYAARNPEAVKIANDYMENFCSLTEPGPQPTPGIDALAKALNRAPSTNGKPRDDVGGNVHLETALLALRLGFSPLPPKQDGTKAPLADIPDGYDEYGKPKFTWAGYQANPATEKHVREWYASGRTGNGLACGVGGVELFEFDCGDTYRAFLDVASASGLGELIDRIRTGYEESTPGGGIHWFYLADEIRGNTKLACRPDGSKVKTLVETRGQGGFAVIRRAVAGCTRVVGPTGY